MKTKIVSAILAISLSGFCQNQMRLNPLQNLIEINPSFAGSNGGFRMQSVNSYFDFKYYSFSNFESYGMADASLCGGRSGIAAGYDLSAASRCPP